MPAATTTMSARLTWPARSLVRRWHTVTVASSLTQQERRGHPDDGGPADDDRVAAFDLDPGAAQDLDRGVRRGRQEAVVAETEQPGVHRVDPVDVLGRIDRVDDRSQPDGAGKRHLDDDAIDGRVVVELADRGRDLGFGRLALELDEAAIDPDLVAAAEDPLEVDRRRRVLADDDDPQPGWATLGSREARDVLGDRGPDLGGDRSAFEQPGPWEGHAITPRTARGEDRAARRRRRLRA